MNVVIELFQSQAKNNVNSIEDTQNKYIKCQFNYCVSYNVGDEEDLSFSNVEKVRVT